MTMITVAIDDNFNTEHLIRDLAIINCTALERFDFASVLRCVCPEDVIGEIKAIPGVKRVLVME